MVASFLVLWCIVFFETIPVSMQTDFATIADKIQLLFSNNLLLENAVCISIVLLNAFLLAQINNRFTLIRTRTFLPIFIFLLLIGSWNETHTNISSHAALTLFMLALFNFFSMNKNRNASEQAFIGSFFIGVASLLINPYLVLIPVCWIGFVIFQSFSLRTFLASVFGVIVPWILFLSVEFLFQIKINFPEIFLSNFSGSFSVSMLLLPNIIYSVTCIIILIICTFGLYSNTQSDAIHTRNKLNFLLLLLISTFILAFVSQNQLSHFLPLLALIYAILVSHPFTLKQNNFYGILFIIFVVLNIAFVISKYVQL